MTRKIGTLTIAVVEEHYAPYVKELRERTRRIMESSDGIEKPAADCTVFAHLPEIKGKVQRKQKG